MSAFIMGGLAGAAAVMLFQRNRRMFAMAGNLGQQVKSRMNGMKGEAIGKMLNMNIAGNAAEMLGFGGKENSRGREASGDETGGLEQVAHLAAQDSEVQRRVNEILEQSGQNRI